MKDNAALMNDLRAVLNQGEFAASTAFSVYMTIKNNRRHTLNEFKRINLYYHDNDSEYIDVQDSIKELIKKLTL